MLRRSFAVLFGLAVALSWVAPLCAMASAPKSAHSCCQAPANSKGAPNPCCCRPLDSAVPHPEVLVPSSADVLLPGAAVVVRQENLVDHVAVDVSPRLQDASPPAPTGLSPPASA